MSLSRHTHKTLMHTGAQKQILIDALKKYTETHLPPNSQAYFITLINTLLQEETLFTPTVNSNSEHVIQMLQKKKKNTDEDIKYGSHHPSVTFTCSVLAVQFADYFSCRCNVIQPFTKMLSKLTLFSHLKIKYGIIRQVTPVWSPNLLFDLV